MNKLYHTIVTFMDENEHEFEVDLVYYVDRCLDSNRDFIDDFEIRSIESLDENAAIITKKIAYIKYYDQIMNAIVANPGSIAEEF